MSKSEKQEIGEGDRESARRYNEHTREFIENERAQGHDLRPDGTDSVSMDELSDAEKTALKRAKEQDPQTTRNYDKPSKSSDR